MRGCVLYLDRVAGLCIGRVDERLVFVIVHFRCSFLIRRTSLSLMVLPPICYRRYTCAMLSSERDTLDLHHSGKEEDMTTWVMTKRTEAHDLFERNELDGRTIYTIG